MTGVQTCALPILDATSAVTVVWSEAYLPGWRAELTPAASGAATGARGSRPLTVEPHGLLQSVRVPAGTWLLTFSYRPRALDLGLAGSLAALAGFAVFGVLAVVRRRRARPAGPRRAGRREVA